VKGWADLDCARPTQTSHSKIVDLPDLEVAGESHGRRDGVWKYLVWIRLGEVLHVLECRASVMCRALQLQGPKRHP